MLGGIMELVSEGAEPDVRAYEVVLRYIEAGILEGRYHPGEVLPPERDLAALLNVGRPAVREAMRVLSAQGLIEASAGRGGGTKLVSSQGDALARIFRLHLAMAGQGISDLTETRAALERVSAAAAARNVTDAQLAEIDETLEQMQQTNWVEGFNALDTEFHVLIARASSNKLVADLTVAIREALKEPIREASAAMPDWQDFRLKLIDEHQAIRDAVAAHDPEEAVKRTEAHIRQAYASLIGTSS
jgi:DNA-binding FadR family transcriptional regulator